MFHEHNLAVMCKKKKGLQLKKLDRIKIKTFFNLEVQWCQPLKNIRWG